MAVSMVSIEAGIFAAAGIALVEEPVKAGKQKSSSVFSQRKSDGCEERTNRWEGLERNGVDDHTAPL